MHPILIEAPLEKVSVTKSFQKTTLTIPLGQWNPHSQQESILLREASFELKSVDQRLSKWNLKIIYHSFAKKSHRIKLTIELMESINNCPVNVDISATLQNSDGSLSDRSTSKSDRMATDTKSLELPFNIRRDWDKFSQKKPNHLGTGLEETLIINFSLSIEYLNPIESSSSVKAWEEFNKEASHEILTACLALLESRKSPQLKIVSSDLVEFYVDKDLLLLRCPLLEKIVKASNTEGAQFQSLHVIEAAEIMRIIVNFWKTGKLCDSWRKPDIISGVATTAAKFGLERLQKLLDIALGDPSYASSTLQLLQVTREAGYKQAEEKIVMNIAKHIRTAKTWSEVCVALYGATCVIDREVSQTVQIKLGEWMNGMLGGKKTVKSSMELLAAAALLGWDLAERKLAESLAEKVVEAKTSQELFACLGFSKISIRQIRSSETGDSKQLKLKIDLIK